MPLALSGIWTLVVLGAVVGLVFMTVYAIWTLRKEDAWEERPPKDMSE